MHPNDLTIKHLQASLRSDAAALARLAASEEVVRQVSDVYSLIRHKILQNRGFVYSTGVGKSGMVAQRFSAALSSISCPSRFIHGTEWFHGDLGLVRDNDMVRAFCFRINHVCRGDSVLIK